jgi:hypothetical protein
MIIRDHHLLKRSSRPGRERWLPDGLNLSRVNTVPKLVKTRLAGCLILLFAVTPCLTSCATDRRVPFNESDFAAYRGPGTGTVVGHLAVTDPDGKLHLGAHFDVEMVPVTPYTQEMVEVELGQGQLLHPPADPRFKKYARIVTADANGNFVFHQVPAGRYFVLGEVDWLLPASEDYAVQWGLERIAVGNGQTVNIVVSHNPNQGHGTQGIVILR